MKRRQPAYIIISVTRPTATVEGRGKHRLNYLLQAQNLIKRIHVISIRRKKRGAAATPAK